jgi:eukaryotic-like serine/threonine-protein kinase
MIGQTLGPYRILAKLGEGGMGEVYQATDTRLGRLVAIKVLPQEVASNPALKARLEREARAISSLNHPHICTLYDIGSQDGTDFLVMEYLEGETLAARLRPRQAASRASGRCREPCAHRDLTPHRQG